MLTEFNNCLHRSYPKERLVKSNQKIRVLVLCYQNLQIAYIGCIVGNDRPVKSSQPIRVLVLCCQNKKCAHIEYTVAKSNHLIEVIVLCCLIF